MNTINTVNTAAQSEFDVTLAAPAEAADLSQEELTANAAGCFGTAGCAGTFGSATGTAGTLGSIGTIGCMEMK